jgi:hypothetical protein
MIIPKRALNRAHHARGDERHSLCARERDLLRKKKQELVGGPLLHAPVRMLGGR